MKKKSIKRVLSVFTGMAMLAALIPATVMADTSVRYVDGNGNYGYCPDYTVVNETDHEWNNKWYVVKEGTNNKVIIRDRIEITGDVNLILDDTVTLYAMNGIHVSPGNSLTIYGRSIDLEDGTKKDNLEVWMSHGDNDFSGYAAMGGNAGEKNGTINLYSGRIDVKAAENGGAGIGTGNYTSRDAYMADPANKGTDFANITIKKAFVSAVGGYNAAAIGGGDYADSEGIIVNGGTVRAIGNYNQQENKPDDILIGGAGIGGGRGGCLFTFSMSSGNVIAASSGTGSGLGNGYGASPSSYGNRTIVINGGSLLALSNWGTSAMIGGKDQDMSLFRDSVVNVYNSAKIQYADVAGWPVDNNDDPSDNTHLTVTLDVSEYKNHNMIYFEPCTHEEHIFVPSAGTHEEKCATCRVSAFSSEKHELNNNNICSVCGYEVPVRFKVQPKLTGKITLFYGFRCSEDLKKDKNAYVSFTASGKTWTAKFTDMDYDPYDNTFNIIVPVDAMNLADSILMNVYNGNNEKQPLISDSYKDYSENGFSYSIKEYAEHIISTTEYEEFATAIYNYGAMVCNYFKGSYGEWEPYMNELAKVSESDLSQYALQTTGKDTRPDCISRTTICVSFESDNTLRITYYLVNDAAVSNLNFYLDEQSYIPKQLADGVYAIDVENIPAPFLDDEHEFTVTDGSKTYTITASAMSYALTSMKSGKEKRVNLGKAFYLYNKEANEYFNH